MQTMLVVSTHLFHLEVTFRRDGNAKFLNFTVEELQAASRKLKRNKAPELGSIPWEIIKAVAQKNPDWVLAVYNNLAQHVRMEKN